jgi:hypothetical protein
MAFLNSVEQLRAVEWSKAHLWDVRFPSIAGSKGAPAPFTEWFPASSFDHVLFNLDVFTFELPGIVMSVPKSTAEKTISMTFYDDVNGVLEQWFQDWVERDILLGGKAVATLEECVRLIQLTRLDVGKNARKIDSLWVYPRDNMSFSGRSDAAANEFTVNLVVAGKASQ